ncbi:MAG: T9SS type A sorting domain-containing protein [Flavobacteriales bacterium]|nr:T9SS type A sorting domain-containing protein [Flavobacteriales bacterium]
MRTTIAFLLLAPFMAARAQVACDILAPDYLHASLDHTWAKPANGSWNTPDMAQVANRLTGDLVLAYDGSSADSLCCSSIANPGAVNGRIALLYRGSCEYALKAKHAQDAGAIAVIIINNVAGAAPVPMGAGSQGQLVNIPVFQIRAQDGALLREALDSGVALTMLLGNKNGYYASDIGLQKQGVLLPGSLAHPRQLAANSGEYVVQPGAWVYNFGSEARSGVELRATISQQSTTLYDESSATVDLAVGDSAFITLPEFDQAAYDGRYILSYTVDVTDADEHLADNTFTLPLDFGGTYALAPLSHDTNIPQTTVGIKPATSNGEYESCVHFRDANASRVAVTGFDRYVSINAPAILQNEVIISRVYQWLDVFTGLSDPAFDISNLVQVHSQEHILDATTSSVETYLQFGAPVVLEDNMRYLFCTAVLNPAIFLGYNEDVHYRTNEAVYDQPTSPNRNGSSWFVGFTGRPVASIGARMIDASTIGIEEPGALRVGASPNPGNGRFQLVFSHALPVLVSVTDPTGRAVLSQRGSGDRLVLDLTGQSPGVYVAAIESANGRAVARLVVE